MKPIKLIMEGFGSYIKRTEIDFTIFPDNALFLITGSTGGGKTTILDAVCFALFGKATGGLRSWEQMRSIGANESVETLVDFTFSIGQSKFRFYRCQKQYRGRRNGELKIKTENSCYELTAGGEKLLETGADRSISAQAQKLLGLDCEQFSRVMILPQGEFRALLLSPSSEKAKLFEKLFDAQQWSSITAHAIEKADKAQETAETLAAHRQAVLSSLNCDSVIELEQKALEASKKAKEAEQRGKTLDSKLKIKREQYNILKKRDELNASIAKSELLLNTAKQDTIKTEAELSSAEKQCEAVPKLTLEAQQEREKIKEIEKTLESIAQIKRARIKEEHFRSEAKRTEKLRAELEAAKNELTDRIAKGEEYISAARRDIERIPTEMAKLQTLKEINDNYKKLDELKAQLKKAEAAAEASKAEHEKACTELEAIKESERIIDEKIRENMAVFLSTKLEGGKPCPVCGSTAHPCPASFAGENQQGLVKNQKELLKLIKEKEARCSLLMKRYSETEAAKQQIKKLLGEQQSICSGYNIYYKTCQRDLDFQTKTLDELNNKKAKLPQHEEALAALKKKLNNAESDSKELSLKLLEIEKQRVQEELKISSLLKYSSASTENENELAAALKQKQSNAARLEKSAAEIQDKLSAAKSKFSAATALLKERTEQLNALTDQKLENAKLCAGFEDTDTTAVFNECEKLNSLLNKTLIEGGELKKETESLERTLKEINRELEKSLKAEKEYSKLKHLADILRGNNPMKVPIKMFVLGIMLDDILSQANKYFSIFSDGRYSLEKIHGEQGGNSLRGLDIEVFDGNYGGKRPVFTLSGGEMFLASLSLAFGLSDVVQGYSGGIRLDSIFIDEGFGSLDSETIDTAMKALDKIKRMGRTVGIISHVSQLSEKIGNKIIVTSGSDGSSVKLVAE